MKIRAITLNNVRRFTAPVTVNGIGDGLNLLCEPNEHGKSTLFDAIQAAFFKPHGSNDKEIKALRPHAGGAPEVSVEVEIAEGRFTITKRWISKPEAKVTSGGKLIAQADAAEAWIGKLLGAGSGGPSGLVWVRQGMTGLTGGSTKEQAAAFEARRDLLTSVSEEVDAMTGGRRMDLALARCKQELAVYATTTGRERAGGPWREATDRVATLQARKVELTGTAATLHDALDQRKRKRRELAELEAPDVVAGRRKRLDDAAAAHQAAERHAEAVETESRRVEAAWLGVSSAQRDLDALRSAKAERGAAADAEAEAATAAGDSRAELATRSETGSAAQKQLETAQAALKAAEDSRRLAARRQSARDGAARRADLQSRLAQAEAARKAMEETAAAAKIGPDRAALQKLETLGAAVDAVRAARDAMAAQLRVTYAPGREGALRMDGSTLADGTSYPIPRDVRLDIDGIGAIEIWPAVQDAGKDPVESAAISLAEALSSLGVPDLVRARDAAGARAEAEQALGEAKAILKGLAPEGIDALREALARIPAKADTEDGPDLPTAEAAFDAAVEAHTTAQSRRDAAAEGLAGAREAAAAAEVTLSAARDRLDRAKAAIYRLGDATEAGLAADMAKATAALKAAEALHAEQSRAAPDLAAAEAAFKRARAVDETARADIARLRPEIATLDERIARGAGNAVEERLAEVTQELEAAAVGLARIEHEVAVLRKLEQALEAARAEARERYFAPVAAELRPLLHLLWPDAELTWGHDSLLPETLIRGGQPEPIDILSGGTQEQVALLVRLAFARMLARDGRHAPVLLDDALVFTDDDRIERMFTALHRQAGDLQIIVLSCRQRAFRELGGRGLRLAPAAEAAE